MHDKISKVTSINLVKTKRQNAEGDRNVGTLLSQKERMKVNGCQQLGCEKGDNSWNFLELVLEKMFSIFKWIAKVSTS